MEQHSNRKRRKKKNNSNYYMLVTVVGVIAISLSSFAIFKTFYTGGSIPVVSVSSTVGKTDPSKDKEENIVAQQPINTVNILSGAELDNILFERTGVSQLNILAGVPIGGNIGNTDPITTTTDTETKEPEPQKILYTAKDTPATIGTSGKENIATWKNKNSDVKGWMRIPNTNIDFPVVVGPNNLYYNALGYAKESSKNGVIWADSDTKFGNRNQISKNNVIYGHNWTNVSGNPRIGDPSDVMYAQLPSFHHLDFAQKTPYIYYSTEAEEMVWKVFAVFYTEDTFNYIISDGDDAYMNTLISEAKKRSLHNYDVDINSSDKVITLSTCTRAYGNTDRQRYVIMARLMRPGETISPVTITANTGFKKPQL